MAVKRLFNDQWSFQKAPLGTELSALPEEKWLPVDLPHDWLIENAKNLYETGEGWYRRRLPLQLKEGEKCILRFEGVYMNSTVFVNGHAAREWKYGYSTFDADITAFVQPGENEILVRCVHQSPNSRWYSGAGIYRNVYISILPPCHILPDGVYITPVREADGWRVEIDTEICAPHPCALFHRILDGEGREIAACRGDVAQGTEKISQQMMLSHPHLWDTEDPYLYTLETRLEGAGECHPLSQHFGFRETRFDPEGGFFLNGRHVKMNGVCLHHDLGALGAAMNKAALRRQLQLMLDMGVNALRTSHNMPAVELMELCDEMGILVDSEAFDMWERPKTTYDYGRFFPEWADKDVQSWVRRDRNHPSLVMWSIGNEIYDTHADVRGQEVTKMLMDYVRRHDPKGHAPCTIGSNYIPWEGAQKCADLLKISGYNYAERLYHDHHAAHPDWVIYGSETFSIVQSRGIYHFPCAATILAEDDLQCSALGNSNTSWGAKSYEKCITDDRDAPFSMGQFLWTGTDYIGEPTPYHTKNSYFGLADTAGFPKDAYYVFKAAWTDYKKAPFVHVFPYWDFNPGQLIDVQVCSNAPRVQLFLNGQSQGCFDIDHEKGLQLIGRWQIPYEEGVLRAEAYDENGRLIAVQERHSFSDPRKICLKADKGALLADGRDMIFVEISMEDENGHPVENAVNRVHVHLEGPGRLMGLDNGDSTDWDQWKGESRRLFSGKLLAMIGAVGEEGKITLHVESPGLPDAALTLSALPAKMEEGVSCRQQCNQSERQMEIPVRKILLTCAQRRHLGPDCREAVVEAKILPENATYADLVWRVTTPEGIDTNLADIQANGLQARITAKGDGKFFVRCMAKNGAEHPRILSYLEMEAEGLGPALTDPYQFVSGGLHAFHYGDAGTGNERGFATASDGETVVGFKNLDFGPIGSDEFTLPVFTLNSDPYHFQLWRGDPRQGGELILDDHYQKPSIWNTYQPETYRLPKRLTGVCDLSFVAWNKMHVKGFRFKKYERAYEMLPARSFDSIYGDDYRMGEDGVYGIGNNVSLNFENMCFGKNEGLRLTICGKTPLPRNSIHVRFQTEEGELPCLAEFDHAPDWAEQSFILPRAPEKCTVMFLFLPGCQFDFKWFRFEKI